MLDFIQKNAEPLISFGISVLIFFGFFLVSKLFQYKMVPVLRHLFSKLKGNFATRLLERINLPLSSFWLLIGAQIALSRLFPQNALPVSLTHIFRSGYALLVGWTACNLVDLIPILPQLNWNNSEAIKKILRRILKALILAFAVVIVIGEFGYDVNGLVAGLGLGGLTISLAAKDSAANMFSGLLLLIERPFELGDWISCTAAEGTVEDISFRSTKIRTFANTVSVVPNSVLCAGTITNVTRMEMRLSKSTIGITYDTPRDKIEKVIAELREMLTTAPDIVSDTVQVRLTGFGASSIDVLVQYYTTVTAYKDWLAVTERVNFDILSIMRSNGVEFAFPSRSIYIEKSGQ
ncbi:MAG: mechanosensitive ion channel family protein [Pygmaiobacter massiliensis]|nr:mechanosensitive ion channel family protein [Pygmaiobacter massiliensis]